MHHVDWWTWQCARCDWKVESARTVNNQQSVAQALICSHVKAHESEGIPMTPDPVDQPRHPYVAAGHREGQCATCGLGPGNRVHRVEPTSTREEIDAVPGWFQTQAGSELDRMIELVRFAPGQPTGFLHSSQSANGLVWRWALKWFQPKPKWVAGAQPLPQQTAEFWQAENDYWTARANEEAASGNRYEEHAYRTAAHAIRMARDKWEAQPSSPSPREATTLHGCEKCDGEDACTCSPQKALSEPERLIARLREAERTIRSIATMLGWENVPPQDTLEAEIRALKARALSARVPSQQEQK